MKQPFDFDRRSPKNKCSKDPSDQNPKHNLLRDKPRRRTAVPVGNADIVAAEPDPATAEAEDRGAAERTISNGIVLVPGTIDPQIVVVLEAFRMRQNHAGNCESSESELLSVHNLAGAADRASPVLDAELARNHEDVVAFLLLPELGPDLGGLGVLAQAIRSQLALAVVVELAVAGLLDEVEHLLQRFPVGRRDLLPARDGEVALRTLRKRLLGQLFVGVADVRNQLAQEVGLLGHALGLVTREVTVVGLFLFVSVLIGQRQPPDGSHDVGLQFVAVLDESLETVLVEDALGNGAIDCVLGEPLDLLGLTLSDRQCRHLKTPSWCCRLYSAG